MILSSKVKAIGGITIVAIACSAPARRSAQSASQISGDGSFRVEPSRIAYGQKAEVIWRIPEGLTGAVVQIDGIRGNLSPEGRQQVAPTTNQCYRLVVSRGGRIVHRAEVGLLVGRQFSSPGLPCLPAAAAYITDRRPFDTASAAQYSVDVYGADLSRYPESGILFCSVRDDQGYFITGLTGKAHLQTWKTIVEKWQNHRKETRILGVKEIQESARPPIAVSFVTDYSGSMAYDIAAQEQALNIGLSRLRLDEKNKDGKVTKPGVDRFNVVQFDHRIHTATKEASNADASQAMLGLQELGGMDP